MSSLFISILNMSLTASYVALAVMIVRLLLKKAPKIFSYALWSVVLFRLVSPFSFKSRFSLVHPISVIPQDIVYVQNPAVNSGIRIIDKAVNQTIHSILPPVSPGSSVNPMGVIMEIASVIWLLVIAVLLCYSVVSYVRLKYRLSVATLVKDNIFETDLIKTPFVLGFIRPRIYVPTDLAEKELANILKHEQIHIKRRDYLIKPVAFLALILHWFNPLIWISYFLMVKDMEMSCDESVIIQTNEDIRVNYSNSLLSLSATQSGLLSPLAFGESNVKSRIRNVLNYKKPVFWMVLVAVFTVIVLSVGLLANPLQGVPMTALEDGIISTQLLKSTQKVVLKFISTGEEIIITDEKMVKAVVNIIGNIRCDKKEIDKNRSEVRGENIQVHLHHSLVSDPFTINISKNFSSLWVNNYVKPSFSYQIVNSTQIKQEFEAVNQRIANLGIIDTVEQVDQEKSLHVVREYFNAFVKADYDTMSTLATEHHNNNLIHDGDVWGMKWAKVKEIEFLGKPQFLVNDNLESTLVFGVSVEMETVKTSAQYPDTETFFYILLVKGEDGIWRIDGYTTG